MLYKFVPSEEAIYILLVYIFYFCSLFCFVGNSIKCKVNFVATFLFRLPIANRRKYEMRNEIPKDLQQKQTQPQQQCQRTNRCFYLHSCCYCYSFLTTPLVVVALLSSDLLREANFSIYFKILFKWS